MVSIVMTVFNGEKYLTEPHELACADLLPILSSSLSTMALPIKSVSIVQNYQAATRESASIHQAS